MKAITVLKNARKLISKPGSWIKYNFAHTVDGKIVFLFENKFQRAKNLCFCADGALRRAAKSDSAALNVARTLLLEAVKRYNPNNPHFDAEVAVFKWNDARTRTQGQILEGFDKAIKAAA